MTREKVQSALVALKAGRPVLVYDSDDRERETDIVFASQFVTHRAIKQMRQDGGGLICVTVPWGPAEALGLPYLSALFQDAKAKYPVLGGMIPNDIPYDEHSSFSISLNARDTFTGITDKDRANTIKKFAAIIGEIDAHTLTPEQARARLGREFRAPGHVHLLRSSPDPLTKRSGHTELATVLVTMAGIIRTATICEMMGSEGGSMPKEETQAYARNKGYIWLSGAEIKEAWLDWSG